MNAVVAARAAVPAAVSAVVLAAGRGSRMGAQGKLTQPWRGAPLVGWAVAPLLRVGLCDIVAVTGHEAAAVAAALADTPVRLVHNHRYRDGLASSLIVGLQAVGEGPAAVLVCLGDMPLVRPGTIRRLLASFRQERCRGASAGIHVPYFQGRRGNPMLIAGAFLPELRRDATGDSGARFLLTRYPDRKRAVTVADPGVCVDVDTAADLARLDAVAPMRRRVPIRRWRHPLLRRHLVGDEEVAASFLAKGGLGTMAGDEGDVVTKGP